MTRTASTAPRAGGPLPGGLAILVLPTLLLMLGAAEAFGHDIYHRWRKPDNPAVSCCDDGDCRPTRAWLGNDGLWRAWNGTTWLTVPREIVLPTDYGHDGRSHLCEREGYIYCFTPGQVRG